MGLRWNDVIALSQTKPDVFYKCRRKERARADGQSQRRELDKEIRE